MHVYTILIRFLDLFLFTAESAESAEKSYRLAAPEKLKKFGPRHSVYNLCVLCDLCGEIIIRYRIYDIVYLASDSIGIYKHRLPMFQINQLIEKPFLF